MLGAAFAVSALAACGNHGPATPNGQPAIPAPLNRVSASDVVDSISKAGLPAPNPRDVTSEKCPKLRCVQEIDTDTVSILKFPSTGPAEQYAGAISNAYQIVDLVVTFGPTVTADQKRAYERVVEHTAA